MIYFKRSEENPILIPSRKNVWEEKAVFNGCAVKEKNKFHMVYRAISPASQVGNVKIEASSIGHATSSDGVHFKNRRQFIAPEYNWEMYGCEDPRVTKINGKYYIFYTAISAYPFTPQGIKVAVAITKDFKTIKEKHQVTTFNSKAMALFPEKINGQMVGILTANTDMPPAKIALAFFDSESQMWSPDFWNKWYASLDRNTLFLLRSENDHVEMGAPPVKTKYGWLLVYSYIRNYFQESLRSFGIEAVLLDLKNPQKILTRTEKPLLFPEESYELKGMVPNVVFPSGVIVDKGKLLLYYGAADNYCCLAELRLKDLIEEHMLANNYSEKKEKKEKKAKFVRFEGNPIISPAPEIKWQSKATFNPAAVYDGGKVHIVYRAMSQDDTSVFGYASSLDGFNISERLADPIYIPRKDFEQRTRPGNTGCEDPRITKIGNKFYMCYTAFDGINPPRVALTHILASDFLNKKWNWSQPVLISPPGADDKDACILPKKINGNHVIFHRLGSSICLDFTEDLNFDGKTKWLKDNPILAPRKDKWDDLKIGLASVPLETKYGWLLLYHGVSSQNNEYRTGAALLQSDDPSKVIGRIGYPIFESEMGYERVGIMNNVVFPCGAVIIKDTIFIYYGGADKVIGVATIKLKDILYELKK